VLPAVDKKVIYLDQFAISEIYKVKSKTRRPDGGNLEFWQDFQRIANRAYLLQQVIFPASNIHSDKTIVSPFASDLGLCAYRKSSPNILVMQTTQDRTAQYPSRCLGGT
jgi:hypothetical protein